MQILSYVAAGLAVFGFAGAAARTALAEPPTRISGPFSHENLAVYFIHGKSAPGSVPLTLQEALEKGSVRVLETGAVNELKIENTGSEDVFIQSGDIVKGGRQDRVLSMSFILPPKSGEVALSAFCVEHGRWSARGSENAAAFSSATEALPSREAKLAMRTPIETPPEPANSAHGSIAAYSGGGMYVRQSQVWDSVAATQMRLSDELSTTVASPQSATSLQLALENEKLQKARDAYVKALQDQGTREDDIVGYALAINGRISSADVYPSNALFRKMWEKQLTAGVTEAIGAKTDATTATAPTTDSVAQFLAAAEKPKAEEQVVNALSRQEVRDADKSLFVEAQSSSGAWLHRNYLAK
jgi:ARG and Rhodanese-Phosphatase-superfamily-associated Protein domain